MLGAWSGERLAALVADVPIPPLITVRQAVRGTASADPESDAREALAAALPPPPHHGARAALALGSRGMGAFPALVKGALEALRRAGYDPFLMPAMGSHGGGTPEGQTALLHDYGVGGLDAPILADDATRSVGRLADGTELHASQVALGAELVVVLNRVKSHTGFRGEVESGPSKMLVLGLGKRPGAAALHARGYDGFGGRLVEARDVLLRRYPPVVALAVVENGAGAPSRIEALPAARLAQREPQLLWLAKELMPRLPFAGLDVLVVDRAGKDVSGLGMDPNVTGRHPSGAREAPDPTRIALLSLTPASEGNANGMGHADTVTRAFADAVDPVATWTNAITSTSLPSARLPVVMPDESACVRLALRTCGVPPAGARVAWIRDTAHLSRMRVSQPALAQAQGLEPVPGGDAHASA